MKYVCTTRTVNPETTIVFCQGEMNTLAVEELHQAVDPPGGRHHHHLIPELQEVKYVSSSVLQFLIETNDRLKKKGGRASLVGAGPVVRSAFQMAQLDSLFEFCETLEELRIAPKVQPTSPACPGRAFGQANLNPAGEQVHLGPGEGRPRRAREDLPQASPEARRRVLALLGGTGHPDRGFAGLVALPLPNALTPLAAAACHKPVV